MKTICQEDMCAGCKACINSCPQNAIAILDSIKANNAVINTNICINCGLCIKVCPNLVRRELKTPVFWKQGWAEESIRKNSSSGGVASAIIKNFIEHGGYVASCCFEKGEFCFDITNDIEKAKKFAGSKYVKSNPGNIYQSIKKLLEAGGKVLFVGLPCQSAAVQNFCGSDLSSNLYTIDLICHGTPSPKLLRRFIEEQGLEWRKISDLHFREKNNFGLSYNEVKLMPRRVMDSYLLAFLNCVDYTENCYYCRYATLGRVSDITLGDAWGQMSDTDPNGVSLVLCQTRKGIDILKSTNIHFEDVDLDKAVEANHQLRHSSVKHPGRDKFFKAIKKGYTFKRAATRAMPRDSIKQSVKLGLIKTGIIKDSPRMGGYRIAIYLDDTEKKARL